MKLYEEFKLYEDLWDNNNAEHPWMKDVPLFYSDLRFYISPEEESSVEYTYLAGPEDVAEVLGDLITEEDIGDTGYSLDKIKTDLDTLYNFLDTSFDRLVDKYDYELLNAFEDQATEACIRKEEDAYEAHLDREYVKEKLSKNHLAEDPERTYRALDPEYADWRYNQPRKTYIKTFGSKKYDLADYGQLHDWVEANVQFQMKRYPDRYAHKKPEPGEYTSGESNTNTLRLNVLKNLLKQLEAEKADDRICMSIYDEIQWLKGQHVGKQLDNKAREQIKDLLVNDALDAFMKACDKHMYHLPDMEKAKEQFTTACYNILYGGR